MKLNYILLFFLMIFFIKADDLKLANFVLKGFDNKKYNTQELYKDGPILMNFWNLACEPCKKEMKFLNDYDQKYSEYGFNVVSVNMDTPRSLSKVKSYIKSKKYSFQVLSDPRSQLFRKTGGTIMPYTLMVDTSGLILNKHTGYNLGDEIKIEEEIRKILGLDPLEVKNESKK